MQKYIYVNKKYPNINTPSSLSKYSILEDIKIPQFMQNKYKQYYSELKNKYILQNNNKISTTMPMTMTKYNSNNEDDNNNHDNNNYFLITLSLFLGMTTASYYFYYFYKK